MPSVPPELSDYIVDFLHDDSLSLKACGLTCYEWLPTARYHLFASITLHTPHLCVAFKQLMERSPGLGSYVRQVNLSRLAAPGMAAFTSAERSLLEQSLCSIFAYLDHVKTLAVTMLDVSVTIQSGLVYRASLTELVLQYCTFPAFQDFVELFDSYPQLESLELQGVSWKTRSFDPRLRSAPSKLRNLALGSDVDIITVIEWIAAESIHSIDNVSICCTSERDANAAAPLLRILGPQLVSLDLQWNLPAAKTIGLPPALTIEHCINVRKLSLHCSTPYDCMLPWFTSLLSGLSSTHLETIVVVLRVLDTVEAIDWEEVEKILSGPRFANLRSVVFKTKLWAGVYSDRSEVETAIRRLLPNLESKDVLSFSA